jgi:membrane fusion protein (multidrug efflux system)
VAFSVTEGELVTIRQKQADGKTIDPNSLDLSLRLANDSEYDEPGRLEFVEYEVDPQTGTVTAWATFSNPHHILIPGQFVKLEVREKTAPDMPVIPQTAVLQDREGPFVFVLGDGNTVSQRRITTGMRVDGGWAVTSGLTGGEQVVVQGTQRLASGMTVAPSEGQRVGGGS